MVDPSARAARDYLDIWDSRDGWVQETSWDSLYDTDAKIEGEVMREIIIAGGTMLEDLNYVGPSSADY